MDNANYSSTEPLKEQLEDLQSIVRTLRSPKDSLRKELDEADVRRFVACWNACEGIPTEMLKAIIKVEFAEVQPKTAELPKGVAQFTKKPVTINAIQWDGKNLYEVISFTQGVPNTRSERAQDAWDDYAKIVEREGLHIDTLEGKMLANVGDWIIRGVKGEHYPCKPDIFAATYEPATAPQAEVQAEPVAGDYPHEQMDALALARYKVIPSDQSMYWRYAVVAGEGLQHLYNGSEVDCQIMARKFAGAFLDGAFTFHQRYSAPQAQPSDALCCSTPGAKP